MLVRKKPIKAAVAAAAVLSLASCASMPEGIKNNLGNLTALAGGVTAALVCANNSDNDALCAAVALAAAYAGKVLGDEIAKNLSEKEQRLVIEEAALALETGKPRTVSLPDSGGQVTITPTGKTETKTVKATVFADMASTTPATSTYVVTSEIRGADQALNIFSEPKDGARIVGQVTPSEALHVFGSPEESEWSLVGYRAYYDTLGYEEPIAIGYVRSDSLTKVLDKSNFEAIKTTESSAWPEKATEVQLSWITTCDVLDMDLQKADGTSVKDQSQNCAGPGYTPIAA